MTAALTFTCLSTLGSGVREKLLRHEENGVIESAGGGSTPMHTPTARMGGNFQETSKNENERMYAKNPRYFVSAHPSLDQVVGVRIPAPQPEPSGANRRELRKQPDNAKALLVQL